MEKRIKLKKDTVNVMNQRLGVDAAKLLQNKLDSLGGDVTITNTGVVSSGKSSLYNALLDIGDGERFSVGAARTTITKDIEPLTENVYIIDTPGINIESADDEVALNAVCASSIIVMVHNIRMGMLHKNEVEWIRKIASNFSSPQETKDRFVFVCSWIDGREREETYQKTLDEIKKILVETMGVEPDFYTVSATRFQKGKSINKPEMIEMSGIPRLKADLLKKAEYFNSHYGDSHIKAEIIKLCEESLTKLNAVKIAQLLQCKTIEDTIDANYKSRYREWASVFNLYQDMHEEYNSIKKRIRKLKDEVSN